MRQYVAIRNGRVYRQGTRVYANIVAARRGRGAYANEGAAAGRIVRVRPGGLERLKSSLRASRRGN